MTDASGWAAYERSVADARAQLRRLPLDAPVRLRKRTSNLFRPRQQSALVAEASQGCDSLPLSSLARRDAFLHLGQFRLHCRTPTLCHRQPLADVALAIDLRCAVHAANCFL